MLKIIPNKIHNPNCRFLLILFDLTLHRIREYFQRFLVSKDIVMVDVDECFASIEGKIMIMVETPMSKLLELLK